MNVELPMAYNLSPTIDIPLLSLQAWERLLAKCPVEVSEAQSENTLALWSALRIASLPGWNRVAVLPDEVWVFQYEQLQETLAKQQRKTGRPQNGVFYTSKTVAAYLTGQTLGQFLTQTDEKICEAMQRKDIQEAHDLWAAVQQVRVIDPACGTGVFLVEALHCFSAFYQKIAQRYSEFQLHHPAHFVVRQQLAGIDLDPLSVMITELRLVQWAARLDERIVALDAAILAFYVGDTLADTWGGAIGGESSEMASEQLETHLACQPSAKKWQFILGNPPYVSEVRGQAQRFRKLQGPQSRYYQAKMDLCDGFLAWAIEHLQPGGQCAYVLPAYWTQRSSTALLRAGLWQEGHLVEVWTFEGHPLFKNAPGHHSALLIWQKNTRSDADSLPTEKAPFLEASRVIQYGQGESAEDLSPQHLKTGWITLEAKTGKLLMGEAVEMGLLAKLSALLPLLRPGEIQQGIVIPQGRLKPKDRARLPLAVQEDLSAEPGAFVLNEEEVQALHLSEEEHELLQPYYRPAGFRAFQGFFNAQAMEQIIYTDLKNRQALTNHPEHYARLRAHLDRFAAVNTSAFAPYGLHRSRQSVWFKDACKILAPRQVLTPAFAAVPFPAYVNEGFLILRSSEDPQWLCALLNSHLAWFWFYHQKRKGPRLQIDKEVLNHFPQPLAPSPELREECIYLAQQLALPEASPSARNLWLAQLNACVNQAYQLTEQEVEWVSKVRALRCH